MSADASDTFSVWQSALVFCLFWTDKLIDQAHGHEKRYVSTTQCKMKYPAGVFSTHVDSKEEGAVIGIYYYRQVSNIRRTLSGN